MYPNQAPGMYGQQLGYYQQPLAAMQQAGMAIAGMQQPVVAGKT
jgi:hypothetical protein